MAIEIKEYTIEKKNGKYWVSVKQGETVFCEMSDRDPNLHEDLKNYMLKSIECQILKHGIERISE